MTEWYPIGSHVLCLLGSLSCMYGRVMSIRESCTVSVEELSPIFMNKSCRIGRCLMSNPWWAGRSHASRTTHSRAETDRLINVPCWWARSMTTSMTRFISARERARTRVESQVPATDHAKSRARARESEGDICMYMYICIYIYACTYIYTAWARVECIRHGTLMSVWVCVCI